MSVVCSVVYEYEPVKPGSKANYSLPYMLINLCFYMYNM